MGTGKPADRETGRPGNRPTGKPADRETGRPGNRPTEYVTAGPSKYGRPADRETGRPAGPLRLTPYMSREVHYGRNLRFTLHKRFTKCIRYARVASHNSCHGSERNTVRRAGKRYNANRTNPAVRRFIPPNKSASPLYEKSG